MNDWLIASTEHFWGDIARSDHVLHVYDNDGVFLDTVVGFVQAALNADENAVVVATESHLNVLEARLESYGYNIDTLISQSKFIPINADEIIGEIMEDGKINESHLSLLNSSFLQRVARNNKKFRICGEVAPNLLAQGCEEAALILEELAEKHNDQNPGCVLCAYPKNIFKENDENLARICNTHSKLISGSIKQLTHVFYKSTLEVAVA